MYQDAPWWCAPARSTGAKKPGKPGFEFALRTTQRLLHADFHATCFGSVGATQGHGRATHQHALGRNTRVDQRLAHRLRPAFGHFGIDRGTAGLVVEAGEQHMLRRFGLQRGNDRCDGGGSVRQ